MKSDNPNSGFYEADTSRTLDGNGGNPSCNQGGMAVVCVDQGGGKSSCNITEERSPTLTCTHGGEPVVAFTQNQRDEVRVLGEASGALPAQPGMKQQTFVLQGSMIGRANKNGPQGSGINEDVSFTLDSVDRHAVAYGIDRAAFNQGINAKYNVVRWEQNLQRILLTTDEKKDYFFKFNVDGLLRGDYASRMSGYATARQNGWMSANDIRELENLDRIPEEFGGDLYLINGNMLPMQNAGAFADKNNEETEENTNEKSEVLEVDEESGGHRENPVPQRHYR